MAKRYGIARPTVVWTVRWDGDNIVEIKDAFGPDMGPYFFINEDNNNLCYGNTIEDANQYPVGTLLTPLGGIYAISDAEWERAYQEIDSDGDVRYGVTVDVDES